VVVLALVLAGVLLVAVYLSWTAGRIDRLHARVDGAAAALDAHLLRRAAAALAAADHPGPGAAPMRALADAARAAQAAEGLGPAREAVENALSRAIFACSTSIECSAASPELQIAVRRVALARGFYNGAVRDTVALRERVVPRLAHLAGHAALPGYFEIDDSPLREPAPRPAEPKILATPSPGDVARLGR
jgi:hypothetical protein